ncbi:hypothetical protein IEQ34_005520 [Dendrobium chrysotoxum]|uniref:Uncharacterized protein n=1 Tax=Dendrobium chrysotoxum TaxID=161865 RepID=A0AAV7H8W7_DENCH|nr:hypothetical protein IEQ34_005520 [Dendrobium chrysotoxum]
MSIFLQRFRSSFLISCTKMHIVLKFFIPLQNKQSYWFESNAWISVLMVSCILLHIVLPIEKEQIEVCFINSPFSLLEKFRRLLVAIKSSLSREKSLKCKFGIEGIIFGQIIRCSIRFSLLSILKAQSVVIVAVAF